MSDLIAMADKDLPTAQEVTANLPRHLIQLEDLVIVERRPTCRPAIKSSRSPWSS